MFQNAYGEKPAAYYEYQRPEMQPFVPTGVKRMLDVGCGRGGFSRYFKQVAQVETWGVEMMPEAAHAAEQVLDHVLCGDFATAGPALPTGSFDAIICNDVLEHMLEPEEALRMALGLLAPGGVVVASLPNFLYWPNLRELLVERDWRYREAGILDRTHLRFFTRKSIVRLFIEAGYQVERCEGINPYAGPARSRWLWRLLRRPLEDYAFAQYAVVARPATQTGPGKVSPEGTARSHQ